MEQRAQRAKWFVIGIGFFLTSCAPTSKFVVRDAALSKNTKRVVVLPFLNANARASEDTAFQTSKTAFTLKFLEMAQPMLSGKYEFIPQDQIMAELKARGFEGFDPNKGTMSQMFVQPTGYSLPEAIQIGEKLKADAVFLGSVAMTGGKPPFAISVRMVDVKTGKVIVASSAASGGGLSFTPWNAPIRKIVERFAKEAP